MHLTGFNSSIGYAIVQRIFAVLLVVLCSSCSGQSVVGEYVSVTETEYSIELALLPDGKAVLDLEVVAVDEDESGWSKSIAGTWAIQDTTIYLNLGSDGVVEYEIKPCLSFGEFGFKGCGFGLKAINITAEDAFLLKRYGLWRRESLPPDMSRE